MPDELEVGDRAPNFELPACYGYKAGASSPSAEEKVVVNLKDFQDKKWVVLAFYGQDSSPEDTRLLVGFNEWNRKFKTREVEVLGCSWNGVNAHQQFIEVYYVHFLSHFLMVSSETSPKAACRRCQEPCGFNLR